MNENHDALLARRALRAEQARRRRHAAGATPRTESLARTRPWLAEGLSRTAWFAARRRSDDYVAVSAPDDHVAADRLDCFVAIPLPDDFVATVPEAVELDEHVTAPNSDGFVASPLVRRLRHLPGGRDPAFLASLERLVTDAPAARAAWGEADPELAALISAED